MKVCNMHVETESTSSDSISYCRADSDTEVLIAFGALCPLISPLVSTAAKTTRLFQMVYACGIKTGGEDLSMLVS